MELTASLPHCFVTSTCSQKGYGYARGAARGSRCCARRGAGDENESRHGAWTKTFLVEHLRRRWGTEGGSTDLVALFQEAHAAYVQRHPARGDRPCCALRIGDRRYNTNDGQEPTHLPRGAMFVRDVLGMTP
jgi:hypothetical protein